MLEHIERSSHLLLLHEDLGELRGGRLEARLHLQDEDRTSVSRLVEETCGGGEMCGEARKVQGSSEMEKAR